jgi:hypothetical protein
MSNAGKFEILVSAPYPCWCSLLYDGRPISTFSHKALSDLKYAVEKAMQEARLELGSDKDEV